MSRKITVILVSVLFVFCVGLIAYGVITQPEGVKENLPRLALVVASFIALIYKITVKRNGASARNLAFYEKSYRNDIGNVFTANKSDRKNLLKALKYYNENKFDKSESILKKLSGVARNSEEIRVCGQFLAMLLADRGYPEKAIAELERIYEMRMENETVCNNLALLYMKQGNNLKATELFEEVVRMNPDYDVVYCNMANLKFNEENLDEAVTLAETALSKNSKLYQASNLLAIIYNIKGDKENTDKYYRMSVKNGADSDNLKSAMANYKAYYQSDVQED